MHCSYFCQLVATPYGINDPRPYRNFILILSNIQRLSHTEIDSSIAFICSIARIILPLNWLNFCGILGVWHRFRRFLLLWHQRKVLILLFNLLLVWCKYVWSFLFNSHQAFRALLLTFLEIRSHVLISL